MMTIRIIVNFILFILYVFVVNYFSDILKSLMKGQTATGFKNSALCRIQFVLNDRSLHNESVDANLKKLFWSILTLLILIPTTFTADTIFQLTDIRILLSILVIIPILISYSVWSISKLDEIRKSNRNLLVHFINVTIYFLSLIPIYVKSGGFTLESIIFAQSGGFEISNLAVHPLNAILSLVSLYGVFGLNPLNGVDWSENVSVSGISKQGKSSINWMNHMIKYIAVLIYIFTYLGSNGNILIYIIELTSISLVFTAVSSVFPKMNIKTNMYYNSFIAASIILISIIQFLK